MEQDTLKLIYVLRTFNTESGRDRKSKFEIYLNEVSLGLVNSPIYDGARLLLKMGYSPDTLLTTQSKDSQHPSWHPKPLHHWAKWTTEEPDDRSVRLKRFTEWERVGVEVPFSKECDPTYLNNRDSLKTALFGGLS